MLFHALWWFAEGQSWGEVVRKDNVFPRVRSGDTRPLPAALPPDGSDNPEFAKELDRRRSEDKRQDVRFRPVAEEAIVVEPLLVVRYWAAYKTEKARREALAKAQLEQDQARLRAESERKRSEEEARRQADLEAGRIEQERQAPFAKLKLAKLYLANGLTEKARRALDLIVREYPDSPAAKEARQVLKEMPPSKHE
jgi:multidrug efflux pump subunit AcrA (membrane-fusion protein)